MSEKPCSINGSGSEIKVIGINYTIYAHERANPFKLFNKKPPDDQEAKCQPNYEESNPRVRQILKDVNCRARPWEILAIVGPSGAGKSSLLEILAGKLTPQSGSVFVNQSPINKAEFKKTSGYVTQRDTLFPLLTVEETLMFSGRLRLRLPQDQLNSRVESLIQELGLEHVANTRVGDDHVRGVSGGERRRVSIGVDVIHDPKVLILDEPTSGLDSTSALQIIDMLKVMAETRGRTIILSIHQPGFRIVKLFNSILLLANGSVLHHGTVDQLGVNLRLMGLQLPLHVNVVEYAIESIETIRQQPTAEQEIQTQLLSTPSKQKGESRNGKCTLQQLFQQSKVVDDEIMNVGIDFPRDFTNSRLCETIILTQRFSKNIFRTRELFACRTIQMLISGLVLGSIFYNLKDDLVGAEERVGLFAFILTFLLSCSTEALPIFLQEREILMKETSSGSYRVSSYAIANGLVYLPFLLILAILFTIPLYWLVGLNPNFMAFMHFLLLIWLILYTANSVVVCFSALVPNFIIGNSLISGVMGSFFLFSGYFISQHGIPSYWIFMHYISLFKYPFEGFLINEFSNSGKCLEYTIGKCMVSGDDMLKEEGYGEESRWRNVMIMACFILVYRFISYVILRCRCSQRSLSGALF
ncbi:ABC_tran domain-containing protein/ABC2_membrane domain-containing protein/PDR_CDR domain-containing protein [Cephalotus follicularis]|uniref:ABC_tran domain-containing protein/ABC2_membrane domain-containing protein/PDR_CDR domain-containing protein n=1 Tax=Cephalotus follicularis TaxID=3775 RepID=A0A1Q3AWT4_CEPFO|nr:ABC_tran domain-containing protein/ABC2_membrane domain-containing protein/PDR_CDR domain-containing protein [Cephalotus follicularis]